MTLCFIDDSIPFDGQTPRQWALGGNQRALVSLATALSERGHDVTVVCRTQMDRWVDGVRYIPLDGVQRTTYDVVVACRKPSLFERFAATLIGRRRVLWWSADPTLLTNSELATALDTWHVEILFNGDVQASRYHGAQASMALAPGVERCFVPEEHDPAETGEAAAPMGLVSPIAVVTGHPDHGLDKLLDLWVDAIRPRVPTAQLHIYSALLSKPEAVGAAVPDAYTALYDRCLELIGQGVHIRTPQPDGVMAKIYQQARLHIHRGHGQEFGCWTVVDSQACGLPVVGTMAGGLPDRVVNGQTGYLVPDDDALANVAVQVLSNDGVHERLSAAAGDLSRRRSWGTVAADFAARWLPSDEPPSAAPGPQIDPESESAASGAETTPARGAGADEPS